MKKTYLIPTLKVVKIQPVQFIATSIDKGGSYNGGTIQSRQSSFSSWEDDNEE